MPTPKKKNDTQLVERCKAVVKAKDRKSFTKALGSLSAYLGDKQKPKESQRSA